MSATHLLLVRAGESLHEHQTACGLSGVLEVPIEDGLTGAPWLADCAGCQAWMSGKRNTAPEDEPPTAS